MSPHARIPCRIDWVRLSHTCKMPRVLAPVLPPGSLNSLQQPVLEIDDRFSLRPWAIDDVPVVVAAYGDPEIHRWIPYTYDTVDAAQVIRKWAEAWESETGACWAISNRSDGSAVGRLAFQTVDLISGSAELAYWVLPQARGAGATALASEALSSWAFTRLGLHRLELHHSVHNAASCHVATAAKFELEGTLRSAGLYSDGWHDTHLHARVGR